MINFSFGERKNTNMLRNLLILSLCIAAISANGEFSVLSYPKSLNFKGNSPLSSQYVGDVLYFAMGNSADAEWDALIVNDPFNMPKQVSAVIVDGVEGLTTSSNAKTFELQGSDSSEALADLANELKKDDASVCDMDFSQFDDAVITYRQCFGDESVPALPETTYLNPALHSADKQFLLTLAFIEKMSPSSNDMVIARLSLEAITKVHGEKSPALAEAKKMLSKALTNFNKNAQKASDSALVVLITNDDVVGKRQKREIAAPDVKNEFNLAKYYSEDYPVIFNIILWFMVTFGLALLAICYAIGSMDPGRDSIIYRMTSTRMKKDN